MVLGDVYKPLPVGIPLSPEIKPPVTLYPWSYILLLSTFKTNLESSFAVPVEA